MKNLKLLLFFLGIQLFNFEAIGQVVFHVTAPSSLEGSYAFTESGTWGADLNVTFVSGQMVIIRDGSIADTLACNPPINGAQVAGKIAVAYRGACEFGQKAYQAQQAGALAMIIINNVPGAPVGMGAGTMGGLVNIPVIMIGQSDGALLRSAIDAGQLFGFIGNKTGAFVNDLGFYMRDVHRPNNFAIPKVLTQNGSDYTVQIGGWAHNYGTANQSNIIVTAEVLYNGNSLYLQNSNPLSISAGDSSFINFPPFSPASYSTGFYELKYAITSGLTDAYAYDNQVEVGFMISDSLYSMSRIDPSTLAPLQTGGLRPANAFNWTWCINMDIPHAGRSKIDAVSFAASTPQTTNLIGKSASAEIYEWDGVNFYSKWLLDMEYYDYLIDQQNQFVKVEFFQPLELQDNKKYLGCVTLWDNDMFLASDAGIDYSFNSNLYNNVFFPLDNFGQWYALGFGPTSVPAIIAHVSPKVIASDFSANSTSACVGTGITFTSNASGSGLAYNWNFGPGASPATANTVGPHYVVYSTPGNKTVSLTVSDGNTNVTETKSNYITVTAGTPSTPGQITGNTTVCEGEYVTYQVMQDPNAQEYVWILPFGWSGFSQNNTITVIAGNTSGYILVGAKNGCGSSSASSLYITSTPSVQAGVGISTPNSSICSGDEAVFTATAQNGGVSPAYLWLVNNINTGIITNTYSITSLQDRDQVKCVMTPSNEICVLGSPVFSNVIWMQVNPLPAKPVISMNDSILGSSSASSYQWFINGDPIAGATSQFYTAQSNGLYTVTITDSKGCTASSDPYNLSGLSVEMLETSAISIYPNPTNGIINILSGDLKGAVAIKVLTLQGQVVIEEKGQLGNLKAINMESQAPGLYFVVIVHNDYSLVEKIIKH